MLRSTIVKLGAALGALTLALPAAAGAAGAPSTGGLAYTDADAPTVSADGSSIAAPATTLLGGTLELSGRLTGTAPGDTVQVQRLDAFLGWVPIATATVAADGTYAAAWKTDRTGRATVRVVPAAAPAATAATAAVSAPAREVAVFRPARATWFGPGFYGRRTACGARMSRRLLGVAHRKLPCGTLVELLHEGRTITVPVVDRGPFRRGTTWDLTAATARALGMTATTTVGAIRVPAAGAPAGTAQSG